MTTSISQQCSPDNIAVAPHHSLTQNKLIFDENCRHLGGNLENGDPDTYSESVWRYLLQVSKCKSVLDLGSGRGHTSQWFVNQGIKVLCVDGLKINVDTALVPTILCDLTETAYIHAVDLVICVEVVEHIEEQFIENLLRSLSNGQYIFMTHAVPGQSGYHHVNCQSSEYWIEKLIAKGYRYLADESTQARILAQQDRAKWLEQTGMIFVKNTI